jgi:nucleotidyltransferase substrate binding protein (TIGR01987 family)
MNQDIRWEQRFSNFEKALAKLTQAVEYMRQNFLNTDEPMDTGESGFVLDEMVKEGLIQRFEYTHELAWNVMKDYALFQGNPNVGGSRDAAREAFQLKLVSDGAVWMDMIGSRNITSYTYNEETAEAIFLKIVHEYYPAFLDFQQNMNKKKGML